MSAGENNSELTPSDIIDARQAFERGDISQSELQERINRFRGGGSDTDSDSETDSPPDNQTPPSNNTGSGSSPSSTDTGTDSSSESDGATDTITAPDIIDARQAFEAGDISRSELQSRINQFQGGGADTETGTETDTGTDTATGVDVVPTPEEIDAARDSDEFTQQDVADLEQLRQFDADGDGTLGQDDIAAAADAGNFRQAREIQSVIASESDSASASELNIPGVDDPDLIIPGEDRIESADNTSELRDFADLEQTGDQLLTEADVQAAADAGNFRTAREIEATIDSIQGANDGTPTALFPTDDAGNPGIDAPTEAEFEEFKAGQTPEELIDNTDELTRQGQLAELDVNNDGILSDQDAAILSDAGQFEQALALEQQIDSIVGTTGDGAPESVAPPTARDILGVSPSNLEDADLDAQDVRELRQSPGVVREDLPDQAQRELLTDERGNDDGGIVFKGISTDSGGGAIQRPGSGPAVVQPGSQITLPIAFGGEASDAFGSVESVTVNGEEIEGASFELDDQPDGGNELNRLSFPLPEGVDEGTAEIAVEFQSRDPASDAFDAGDGDRTVTGTVEVDERGAFVPLQTDEDMLNPQARVINAEGEEVTSTNSERNTVQNDPAVVSGGRAERVLGSDVIDEQFGGDQTEAAQALSEAINVTDAEAQDALDIVDGDDVPITGPSDETESAVIAEEIETIVEEGDAEPDFETAPSPSPSPSPTPEEPEPEPEAQPEDDTDLAEEVGSVTRDREDPTAADDTGATDAEVQASREIDQAVGTANREISGEREATETNAPDGSSEVAADTSLFNTAERQRDVSTVTAADTALANAAARQQQNRFSSEINFTQALLAGSPAPVSDEVQQAAQSDPAERVFDDVTDSFEQDVDGAVDSAAEQLGIDQGDDFLDRTTRDFFTDTGQRVGGIPGQLDDTIESAAGLARDLGLSVAENPEARETGQQRLEDRARLIAEGVQETAENVQQNPSEVGGLAGAAQVEALAALTGGTAAARGVTRISGGRISGSDFASRAAGRVARTGDRIGGSAAASASRAARELQGRIPPVSADVDPDAPPVVISDDVIQGVNDAAASASDAAANALTGGDPAPGVSAGGPRRLERGRPGGDTRGQTTLDDLFGEDPPAQSPSVGPRRGETVQPGQQDSGVNIFEDVTGDDARSTGSTPGRGERGAPGGASRIGDGPFREGRSTGGGDGQLTADDIFGDDSPGRNIGPRRGETIQPGQQPSTDDLLADLIGDDARSTGSTPGRGERGAPGGASRAGSGPIREGRSPSAPDGSGSITPGMPDFSVSDIRDITVRVGTPENRRDIDIDDDLFDGPFADERTPGFRDRDDGDGDGGGGRGSGAPTPPENRNRGGDDRPTTVTRGRSDDETDTDRNRNRDRNRVDDTGAAVGGGVGGVDDTGASVGSGVGISDTQAVSEIRGTPVQEELEDPTPEVGPEADDVTDTRTRNRPDFTGFTPTTGADVGGLLGTAGAVDVGERQTQTPEIDIGEILGIDDSERQDPGERVDPEQRIDIGERLDPGERVDPGLRQDVDQRQDLETGQRIDTRIDTGQRIDPPFGDDEERDNIIIDESADDELFSSGIADSGDVLGTDSQTSSTTESLEDQLGL